MTGATVDRGTASAVPTRYRCDGCGSIYSAEAHFLILGNVEDVVARLDPGSVVPAGECHSCGAFVYIEKERPEPGDLVELLRGLEWSGTDGHSQGGYVEACPSCSGTKPGSGDPEYEGHADGCTLAAVLAGEIPTTTPEATAIEQIRARLDGREWEVGDLDEIAEVLRGIGCVIRDPSEVHP